MPIRTKQALSGLAIAALLIAGGCDAASKAVESVIEAETGCTNAQLGNLNEPSLPNCSKAAACCKFVKGECGKSTLITPPQAVIEVCNVQETVLSSVITTYQGLKDGDCPEYLKAEGCADGLQKTQENYVATVDLGTGDFSADNAPSCALIVEQTVHKLNDELGDSAKYLPAACEK